MLFPEPVGATARTSRRASIASTTSAWPGRNDGSPKTSRRVASARSISSLHDREHGTPLADHSGRGRPRMLSHAGRPHVRPSVQSSTLRTGMPEELSQEDAWIIETSKDGERWRFFGKAWVWPGE